MTDRLRRHWYDQECEVSACQHVLKQKRVARVNDSVERSVLPCASSKKVNAEVKQRTLECAAPELTEAEMNLFSTPCATWTKAHRITLRLPRALFWFVERNQLWKVELTAAFSPSFSQQSTTEGELAFLLPFLFFLKKGKKEKKKPLTSRSYFPYQRLEVFVLFCFFLFLCISKSSQHLK